MMVVFYEAFQGGYTLNGKSKGSDNKPYRITFKTRR